MTMKSLVMYLLIGLFAGWLAGRLTEGHGFGLKGNLIVGAIGALVGGYLCSVFGFYTYSPAGSLLTATVGAVVLLFLIHQIPTISHRFGKH